MADPVESLPPRADFRAWIVSLIDAGAGQRYGPRGGEKPIIRPFDGSQIVSAHFQGHELNVSAGGVSLEVQLSDGGWLSILGEYRDDNSDETFAIPLADREIESGRR